jgi:hypothetical protein
MMRLLVVARATYAISSPLNVASEQDSWASVLTRSSKGCADAAS